MSKLYTKTGDKGTTNLYDMKRLWKDNMIFEVLGDLDELSACIGMACALYERSNEDGMIKPLRWIQSRLLDIGSDFATQEEKNREKLVKIEENDTQQVEYWIDTFSAAVPPLKEFILPGKDLFDSQLHICRAVCRRAERHMWKLRKETPDLDSPDLETFRFVNRLSDFFFAMARFYTGGEDFKRSDAKKEKFTNP